ncbi:MAG: hypothetical protein RL095_67 [Verrucomicrobiota bacterium]|jgi:hypothetical protein
MLPACTALLLAFAPASTQGSDDDPHMKEFNRLEVAQQKVAVEHLQDITEWALTLRAGSLNFVARHRALKKLKQPLGPADIEAFSAGVAEHLSMRREFLRVLEHYSVVADPDHLSLVSDESRLKGGLIALAAAVVLYDNHAFCYAAIRDDSQLRKLAERADSGYGIKSESFSEVMEAYHSRENRLRFRRALDLLQTHKARFEQMRRQDPQVDYLLAVIESSPSVTTIGKGGFLGDYAGKIGLFAERVDVKGFFIGEQVVDSVSGAFGNAVGLIQTRHGRLFQRPEVTAAVGSQLKPLDILLEKTPFRLTDKLIPGHFGHVAIWLGTEAELKAAGLWEDPLVRPHHDKIRQGRCVLEALRDGVQLNTLARFLDVDDVAILRCGSLDREAQAETLRRAFRQHGKAYDFNFDVGTLDRIVCSELAYQTFTSIQWPTERTLGRATISPDNVAVKARDGKEFQLISFWHEGKEVPATEALPLYRKLVAAPGKP